MSLEFRLLESFRLIAGNNVCDGGIAIQITKLYQTEVPNLVSVRNSKNGEEFSGNSEKM